MSLCQSFKWHDCNFRALRRHYTNIVFFLSVPIIWQSLQSIWKQVQYFQYVLPQDLQYVTYTEAARAFRVFRAARCRGSKGPLSAYPKSLSLFLGAGLSWGRRLPSARLIRGIPYLDDSLVMMALTGRIEFRSFLCCSIRDDWAETEKWEAGGLWITHGWPTVAWRKKENKNGAQLSGLACTSTNWALMVSNLIFSWTALATLFLSNGSETQGMIEFVALLGIFLILMLQLLSSGGGSSILCPLTFHTYVFVSPLFRIVLGQSSSLSNTDHLLVPPAIKKKQSKEIIYCFLDWK